MNPIPQQEVHMTSFAIRLTVGLALLLGLAASPAAAQLTDKASTRTSSLFRITGSNASQGVLTVQSAATNQTYQLKASGRAGTGDRARIPANVTAAIAASVIERAQAQATCNQIAEFMNNPPELPDDFPFDFPDMGPTWTCTAKQVVDRVTRKSGWTCDCVPEFPF